MNITLIASDRQMGIVEMDDPPRDCDVAISRDLMRIKKNI
jgi:hypothetical protein